MAAFLSCVSQGVHPTHPPPGHSWAAQSITQRRSEEQLGKSSAERTLGGLPLFLFSPAAGAISDEEAAVPAVVLFLFLLPLGRPRPRFTGGPGKGNKANREHIEHVSSSIAAEQGKRDRCEKGGRGRTDPSLSSPPAEHPLRARRGVCDHQRCRRLESQTWWLGKEGRYGDC